MELRWGSKIQTFALPLDLASADNKSKWTYVQHRIVGASHTAALCAAFQELYPGLGFSDSTERPLPYDVAVFGTPAAELYGKPDTFSPASSPSTHSHRRPPPSTSRPLTHGGSGTKVPDRRPPLPSISTASLPLFRRPMVSQNQGSPQRPMQNSKQTATGHRGAPVGTVATRPRGQPVAPLV